MASQHHDSLTARELRISTDKVAKYKGTAKLPLEALSFPHPYRQIDRRIIDRLKRDFEGEGCLKTTNRIPAVIDDEALGVELHELQVDTEAFRAGSSEDPPQFTLGQQLECLHGQHRILAADEFLERSQKWWIVDLFGADLEDETKDALREGYSYSAPYASGEIFYHMRLCHIRGDDLGEQRWRARLSEGQAKYYDILLKRTAIIDALDSVLPIQGVWRGFYVGSLNHMIAFGADEEVAHAIIGVKTCFARIFGSDESTMGEADPLSIECIQSRAPGLSRSDFNFIEEHREELFPGIKDPRQRSDIAMRLLSTQELIPSLWTLICDIRYLKRPVKILNTLLPPKSRKGRLGINNSLRRRFLSHWKEMSGQSVDVQRAASSFIPLPKNNLDVFDVCYQQLWLCSCRISSNLNAYGTTELATLASRLGFSNPQIRQELKTDPDCAMIESTVTSALAVLRPNERFAFDANRARPVISLFKDYLNAALATPVTTASPFFTVHGAGEPLARRCGYGPADAEDLNHLFLEKIHAPVQDYQRGGDEISSFFVKRSRHLAFFGSLDLTGVQWDQTSSVYTAREPSTQTSSLYTAREHFGADDFFDAESFYRTYEITAHTSSVVEQSQQAIDNGDGASGQAQGDGVPGRVITFEEGGVPIQQVAYEREPVTQQARKYADEGKKLQVKGGGYVVWGQCFDALKNPASSTVLVVPPEPARM